MPSYMIEGKRYAARNLAQAMFAHRRAVANNVIVPTEFTPNEEMEKLRQDALLARTQFHSK